MLRLVDTCLLYTSERLVDDILLERRRELWGEGFGITDILRTQRSVERMPLTKEEAGVGKRFDNP